MKAVKKRIGEEVDEGRKRERNSRADSQRMAGEPPDRKESGLHPRDRTCKAHRLQVVEVGHT